MSFSNLLRRLLASAALLALTASFGCAAAPQWTLTVSGAPGLVDSYTLAPSSGFVINVSVEHGDVGDHAANSVALSFSGFFLLPARRIGGITLGRPPGGAVTPASLVAGTYTDVPSIADAGSAPMLFTPSVTSNNGSASPCADMRTDFTLHGIEFVDRVSQFDPGLAYVDVEFTSRCPSLNGGSQFSGRLVWADPTRRAPQLSIVRGSIWEDRNKNGVRDLDEPAIPGSAVTVRPVLGTDFFGTGTKQTVDANGNYELRLPPGDDRLQFEVPSSFRDPPSGEISLAPTTPDVGADDSRDSDVSGDGMSPTLHLTGGDVAGPDAGFRDALTTLEGHAWLDANRNGLREGNETALAVTVCFYSDFHAPLTDHLLACVPADESGYYSFDTYRPVVYATINGIPPDWAAAPPDQSANETVDSDLPLSANALTIIYTRGGRRSVLDLGAFPTLGTISGVVWEDSNHDGIRQVEEPRLAGITMELKSEDFNGVWQRVTTDSEGRYTFARSARTYFVQLVRPTDARFQEYVVSPRDIGSDRSVDSNFSPDLLRSANFAVVGGSNFTNIDVGFTNAPRMPIRGRAWRDDNGNGVQDIGEARLPGIAIDVSRAGRPFASVTTDANGEYEVIAPVGYRYQVGAAGILHTSPQRVITQPHATGLNDSDIAYDNPPFLLSTAAPVIRDVGYFAPGKKPAQLSEYFPFEVGNKWVFRTVSRRELIVCSIARKTLVGGVSTVLFKCSDGQALSLTLDKKGLRLHRLRLNGTIRTLIGNRGATADITASPPMLLAPAGRRPSFNYRGRTTGNGKVITNSGNLSSTAMPMSYVSSMSADTFAGAFGSQLRLSHVFHAERSNGKPIDLGFGMVLTRGVGPTAFFNTDNGRVIAELDSFFRDLDKDGRSTAKDNCRRISRELSPEG